MFSSLLVRASSDKKQKVCSEPIIADSIELSFQTVAQAGCGQAKCNYTITNDEQCLVLCVSSLLAHRDCVSQQLKVTSCKINYKGPSGNYLQTPSLSKLSSKEYPNSLPSLSATKELNAKYCSQYAGK